MQLKCLHPTSCSVSGFSFWIKDVSAPPHNWKSWPVLNIDLLPLEGQKQRTSWTWFIWWVTGFAPFSSRLQGGINTISHNIKTKASLGREKSAETQNQPQGDLSQWSERHRWVSRAVNTERTAEMVCIYHHHHPCWSGKLLSGEIKM